MWGSLRLFKPGAIRKGVFVQATPYNANKNLYTYVEDHYKCPKSDLILESRASRKRGKGLAKLIKLRKQQAREAVPAGYFLTIIFTIQGSIHDITKYITLYKNFSPCLVCIFFAITYIFIAMPLYMVFFFLSNFTRFSYMKIWLAVPILKGVSISMALLNFFSCTLNMSLCSLYLVYMLGTFTNWLDCGFPDANITGCMSVFQMSDMRKDFCQTPGEDMPHVGSYAFMEYVMASRFGDPINNLWNTCLVLLYAILIISECFSKTVLSFLSRLTAWIWIMISAIVFLYQSIEGTKLTIVPATQGSLSTVLDAFFWVACGRTALRRVLPGDLVTYGSITIEGTSPITMAVLITIMRIIFVTTVANLYVLALNKFIASHSIKYTDCIDISALTILYAIIPDQLAYGEVPIIALNVYFALAMYVGMMSTYFSVNSFLTAITDDSSDCREYRTTVVILLLTIMGVANVLIVGLGFETVLAQDMQNFIAPLLTFACVAFFIVSYSPLRIANDFYFVYGQRLTPYWYTTMKFYIIFASAIGISYLLFETHRMFERGGTTANLVAMVLCSSPIVLCAVLRIIAARKKRHSFDAPDSTWGSPKEETRVARLTFNPKRECRVAREMKCPHECLVESDALKKYIRESRERFRALRKKYIKLMNMDVTNLHDQQTYNDLYTQLTRLRFAGHSSSEEDRKDD